MIASAFAPPGELRRNFLATPGPLPRSWVAVRPSAGICYRPTVPFAARARRRVLNPVDVEISGPITSLTPRRLALELAGRAGPLVIGLHSPGGLLAAAERTIETLIGYRGHRTVRVMEQCSSAALGVLAAADWVEAFSDAVFLLHPPASVGNDFGRWTASSHREQADFLDRVTVDYIAWLTDAAAAAYRARGLSADNESIRRRFSVLATRETWIDAEHAYSLGLIDAVIGS